MPGERDKTSENPYESPRTLNGRRARARTPRTRAEEWLIDRLTLLLLSFLIYAAVVATALVFSRLP